LSAAPLLEIKNFSLDFSTGEGTIHAVSDINLLLNPGESLGMVGESGSGKSVTALSILRLIPSPPAKVVSGEIVFHSSAFGTIDLLKSTPSQLRKIRGKEIGMIFQEPMTSLNPVHSCGDQVAEAILSHEKINAKEAMKRCLALFEEVKLPRPEQLLRSFPHQLSGGQRQRVMIAMALAGNPSLLIADEPTTALDVTVQASIIELLKELQHKRNMSILFISHDLALVTKLALNIAVMFRGKIVEQGNAQQIFATPRHPYTKGLLACRPGANEEREFLPVLSDFFTVDENDGLTEKISSPAISAEPAVKKEEIKAGTPPLLKVKNLVTAFPVSRGLFGKPTAFVKAVDDVSFEVYEGETLGLVGESGCGKTTLGRSILRLVEPGSGQVIFGDTDITALSAEELRKKRKDLQIIFQDPYSSLNPRMTIGNAISEAMEVHNLYGSNKQRRGKVKELLEKVGLKGEHFNRYPHEFSGGQRQRICIARSLSLQPRLVICDESVSALDISVQAQVLNLLKKLQDEFKLTYIFITHDMGVVRFLADRIMVMNKGKIEELAPTKQLFANPSSAYTKALLSAIPN
jgi:peptide/nickel transport system ATP-binding protein